MSFVNLGPSDAQNAYIQQTIPVAFKMTAYTIEACGEGTAQTVCRLGVVVPDGLGLTFQVTYKIPPKFLGTKPSRNVKSQFQIWSQSIDPDPPSFFYVTTTVLP